MLLESVAIKIKQHNKQRQRYKLSLKAWKPLIATECTGLVCLTSNSVVEKECGMGTLKSTITSNKENRNIC